MLNLELEVTLLLCIEKNVMTVISFFQVQNVKDKRTYALKCLKKKHILATRQQEHIYSEKKIMAQANSPFICK